MHAQTYYQILLTLALIPSATFGSPLRASNTDTTIAPQPKGAVIPITHRSPLFSHPILSARTDDYIPIFDSQAAELVQKELKAVKNKYSKAAQYLSGVQVAEADVSFQQPNAALPVQAAQSGKTSKSISASSISSSPSKSISSSAVTSIPSSTFVSATTASASASAVKTWSTGVTVVAPNSIPSASTLTSSASKSAATGIAAPIASISIDNDGVFNFLGNHAPLLAPIIGSHTSSAISKSRQSATNTVSTASFVSQQAQTSSKSISATTTKAQPAILPTSLVSADLPIDHKLTDLQIRGKSSGSPVVPLVDYIQGSLDVLYYGNINIGTPSQTLSVDFDTGSADLWFPVGCSNCQSAQFDSSRSSSYRPTSQSFGVQYGSGSVSGNLAQENVNIAITNVQGQYFGAVNSESSDFQGNPNSGVMGMAFSSISSSGKPTYFENLISNKAVSSPLFGFHLTRRQQQGSQLCIGCYDSSKFSGSISWIPVISQTYWSVSLTSFSTNGGRTNALSQSLIGAVDTGTTLIYVPTSIADSFYSQIPGSSRADQYGQGFYQYPCKASVIPSLGFNGKNFNMNIVDFNLGKTSSGSSMCVGAVLAVADGFPDNLAIVGDAFLKNWYSIYDYSNGVRVGLAASTNNK